MPFEVPESWCWGNLLNVCHIFGRIGFRGYTKEDLVAYDGAITLSPSNIIDIQTDIQAMNSTMLIYLAFGENYMIILMRDLLMVR